MSRKTRAQQLCAPITEILDGSIGVPADGDLISPTDKALDALAAPSEKLVAEPGLRRRRLRSEILDLLEYQYLGTNLLGTALETEVFRLCNRIRAAHQDPPLPEKALSRNRTKPHRAARLPNAVGLPWK